LAQSAPATRRPYRGLFGPTEHDDGRPDRLDFTFSLYRAFDDNSRFVTDTDLVDGTLQAQRWYDGAQGSLSYRRTRPTSVITLDGSSTLRHYADLAGTTSGRHGGGVSMELRPRPRWRFQLSDSASYSPYFQLMPGQAALGAADASGDAIDYSVSRQPQMIYGSAGAATYVPARGAEITLNYGYRLTDFFEGSDFSQRSFGGRFTYALSRAVGLRLGYASGAETASGAAAIRHEDLDLGLDYGRSLAFSRRTSFTVSSGSTILSSEEGRHFRLTGSARLNHQVSAHWTSQIEFERGLQVIATAPRPYFATTVTGRVSGYSTRRLAVRWRPIYSSGAGVGDERATYRTASSELRAELAIGRHWAVYVEHFFYSYRFSPQAYVPAALGGGHTRNGLRAGLTLWSPLNGR
jgi:hypothetical protein